MLSWLISLDVVMIQYNIVNQKICDMDSLKLQALFEKIEDTFDDRSGVVLLAYDKSSRGLSVGLAFRGELNVFEKALAYIRENDKENSVLPRLDQLFPQQFQGAAQSKDVLKALEDIDSVITQCVSDEKYELCTLLVGVRKVLCRLGAVVKSTK